MLPGKTYSFGDFLDIARRRRLLLVLPIVTLLGALVYSSMLPDVYQSTMLIAIVPQRVPNDFVRSTVTMRTEERLDSITVQVMSRAVLEPMINEFGLFPGERARLPMEDVVQGMREHVNVDPEKPTTSGRGVETPTAFRVRFTYPDPNIAARVTQRLGSMFVDENSRDRGALAQATDDFLMLQLDEARGRLEAQEKLVEKFRELHGKELPTQLQTNLQAIQNAQMQVQALVEGIARDRDRKLMLERLYQDAIQDSPAPAAAAVPLQTPSTGAPPTARQQLAAARSTLAALELRLTPQHPDIVRTKRLIAELEPKASFEAAKEVEGAGADNPPSSSPEEVRRRDRLAQMRAEIESVDRLTEFKESEERRLRALAADYQKHIEAVPGIESEWVALTRDYETTQAAYKDLLTKSAQSKVAVDLENRQIGENFRVLDPARVPGTPIGPKRILISAIGLGAGLALAIGIALLFEIKDASFRSEADVRGGLSLPVLASIPFVETASEHTRRVRRRWLFSVAALFATAGAGYVFWTLRLWTIVV
jgi:polysaccharide chain length determinant protein (PEP-CTERM system associated)